MVGNLPRVEKKLVLDDSMDTGAANAPRADAANAPRAVAKRAAELAGRDGALAL